MTGVRTNESLSQLLDAPDGGNGVSDHSGVLENGEALAKAGNQEEAAKALYEESLARTQAEARALDQERRLSVAQQQLSEYASQKQEDAARLVNEASEMEKIVVAALGGITDSEALDHVTHALEAFRGQVAEVAREAQAFSAQQKADLERSQNSVLQAEVASEVDPDVRKEREVDSDDDSTLESDGDETMNDIEDDQEGEEPSTSTTSLMQERCRYIPLRLTYEERNFLRLLEAALNVSEYTDKVDIFDWHSKAQRVETQIKRICAILSGLVVAQDYRKGQKLVQSHDFCDNELFFQYIFEIGRRYKIMNPDKMRSEYGKLIYMLMDSSDSRIKELLEFDCVSELKTVHNLLNKKGGLEVLSDPLIEKATAEIVAGDRARYEVQKAIKAKEKARETIARKHRSRNLSEEEILSCLYSISDNNSFLLYNRDPIDRMIGYLKKFFNPDNPSLDASLAISMGLQGARLSHSHERQYQYVLQTLTLWREISNDMFKLWCLAEDDLLTERNYYRLTDTGQGLNRVQQAPQVRRAVHDIILRCKTKIGHWVGSSVVHLGDHNVPNALMFIDKYTQIFSKNPAPLLIRSKRLELTLEVPRILNPVVLALDEIPQLNRDPKMKLYIDSTFGGPDECCKSVLLDFFRHAFDGSGADNFFDAGSCIDGRLTSAWNWCSKIEKKPYYHIFKVAGFVGFDGDFQK